MNLNLAKAQHAIDIRFFGINVINFINKINFMRYSLPSAVPTKPSRVARVKPVLNTRNYIRLSRQRWVLVRWLGRGTARSSLSLDKLYKV